MTAVDLAVIEAAVNQSAAAICAAEHQQICFLMNVYVQPGAGINAWNTGFVIYVTQGAVDKLPTEELAFAIAHEKAHGLNVNKDEGAADAMAVRITYGAGFDPMGGARLMQRIGRNPMRQLDWITLGWLHYPSTGARARRIEDEARRVVPSYASVQIGAGNTVPPQR